MKIGNFDLQGIKKRIRDQIEHHNLWGKIAHDIQRDTKTIKRWFSPKGRGMPIECMFMLSEYPELNHSLKQGAISFLDTLREKQKAIEGETNQGEVWFLTFGYLFNKTAHSPSQTINLLGELDNTYRQTPNLHSWLKECTDQGQARIELRVPYKPEIIPTHRDPFGMKYGPPEDCREPISGKTYPELVAATYQRLHGRAITEWYQDLIKWCELLTPQRSVRHVQKYDFQPNLII